MIENKATQNTDISTKLIKENPDIFGNLILENLNDCISLFPSPWKLANITPVHKKDSKSNYRSIIILSNTSKIYEIFLFKQISDYFEQFLANINVDSEKVSVHNIACCQSLRNGNQLSITKKCLALSSRICQRHLTVSHMTFLIAKLNAYGFSMAALRLIQNYLSNQKQRIKINTE